MRVQKLSAIALTAVAATFSLTACNANGSSTSSSSPTTAASTSSASTGTAGTGASGGSSATGGQGSGSNGSGSGTGTSTASGTGTGTRTGGSACQTANLSFSVSGGMAEGEALVNLKNVGSAPCSMHGFPGVDLKGRDGTVNAARSKMAVPTVTLSPGQTTNFTLHFPPNNTGGSGVTFTTAVITPPNETHSHTMSVGINLPAEQVNGPLVTVDPVGAGK